jgi:hypothetical protein
MSQRFMARIYRIWMMRHVDVPDEIARDLLKQIARANSAGKRAKAAKPKYIPVVAVVGGKSTRTTLVPAGGGHYRMQINTAQRKAAGADAGDAVSVELRIDPPHEPWRSQPICAPRSPNISKPEKRSKKCRPDIAGNS